MNPQNDNPQPQAPQSDASQDAACVESNPQAGSVRKAWQRFFSKPFDRTLHPLAWLVPESKKTLVPPLCPEATDSAEVGQQDATAYDSPAMEGNA